MDVIGRRTPITLDACYAEMERMEREHAAEVEAFKDTIAIGQKRHAEQLAGAVDDVRRLREQADEAYRSLLAGRAVEALEYLRSMCRGGRPE